MVAKLIKGTGGFYIVKTEDGELFTLRPRGKLRFLTQTPTVGDMVNMTPGAEGTHGWLEEILPRRNLMIRPPVSNIDIVALTVAAVPARDLLLIDKLILNARAADIGCVLVCNKIDIDCGYVDSVKKEYGESGVPVFPVSALIQESLSDLKKAIQGKATCFAGQSGVGKSALISALTGRTFETGAISERTERGRHTTRHVELIAQDDMLILDTPGFSLLDACEVPSAELADYYPEFDGLTENCRFQPCMHDTEPDCAVRARHGGGGRYARYVQLLREYKELERGRYK
ncbi:MAG: ribosome small subunit-dependent GTPase A [Oscillospiraceae bacterium]|jgi:ribosome biogenesis GTPase|nr:ribosome small subunit-dependent GTPase A [Oscillospiraceae bacterium]